MIKTGSVSPAKGIAAVHMLPHVNPIREPWNTIAANIGAEIDSLRARVAELEAERDRRRREA